MILVSLLIVISKHIKEWVLLNFDWRKVFNILDFIQLFVCLLFKYHFILWCLQRRGRHWEVRNVFQWELHFCHRFPIDACKESMVLYLLHSSVEVSISFRKVLVT